MQAVSGLSTASSEASKSSSNSPSSLFMSSSSSLSGSASDTSHADGGSSSSSKGEVSPEGCELGYEGPLCAVCSNAYYFSATTTTCKSCEGAGRGQLAILILVPLVMIITLVSFTFATFLMKPSSAMPSRRRAGWPRSKRVRKSKLNQRWPSSAWRIEAPVQRAVCTTAPISTPQASRL